MKQLNPVDQPMVGKINLKPPKASFLDFVQEKCFQIITPQIT